MRVYPDIVKQIVILLILIPFKSPSKFEFLPLFEIQNKIKKNNLLIKRSYQSVVASTHEG